VRTANAESRRASDTGSALTGRESGICASLRCGMRIRAGNPRRKPNPSEFIIWHFAFSLIEMMIAIVILGLGMIMVATMFPVAWTRARQLSDQTNLSAVVEAADATVRLLARVDGVQASGSSFAGDLVFVLEDQMGMCESTNPLGPRGCLITISDTRVHAMNLENIGVTGMRRFASEFQPGKTEIDLIETEDNYTPEFAEVMFTSPQVRFESRVHPPIRSRVSRDFNESDLAWDDLLDSRRYAWAVLHRMRAIIPPGADVNRDPPRFDAQWIAYNQKDFRREFDMYYVMLRRPQSSLRYAQQNSTWAPNPDNLPPRPIAPKAAPASQDLLFPVPWRVQLFFRGPFAAPGTPDETGIPSEVEVNPPAPDPATSPLVIDMFPIGAVFVDEITGSIYRVTQRRFAGPKQDHAFLTLDRQVLSTDMVPIDPDCNGTTCWQLRTVWVFPPPVQAARSLLDPAVPVFEGGQPVVGIELRPLSIVPRD